MAWTNITKPIQGSATKKASFADAVIDCLTYLYNLVGGASGASEGVLNGSFENDTDSDGVPDSWLVSLYPGGSSGIYTANPAHGTRAYYFVSPGGSGKGGGYLTSESYYLCSEYAPVTLKWFHSSSVATVRNIVALLWYDKNKEACATASTYLYDASTGNPTSWTQYIRGCTPPAGARYFKVWLCGCHNSDDTAGTTVFDRVSLVSDEQDIVCGNASAAITSGQNISKLYFSTSAVATANVIGVIGNSMHYVMKDIAGGVSYSVSLRQSTSALLTVTLVLPAGLWTVIANGGWTNYEDTAGDGLANLAVTAIRQS